MARQQSSIVTVFSALSSFGAAHAECPLDIPTVLIGNAGNAADPGTGGLFGSVAYSYFIGTTEVTNAQYVAFLNAIAATDTNSLYNPDMGGSAGGITRSGISGSYIYAAVPGRGAHPVNFVAFWDAARFSNWLHNGQPAGPQNSSTTEDGAYTLTAAGISTNTVTRNAAWRWAVTSVDEWYKAAYHQPFTQGGDLDNYWEYPTSGNTITTAQANYNNSIGGTTPVGSYALNFYGTFDMGGNVWEWNDAIISGTRRGLRGGSYGTIVSALRADDNDIGAVPTGGGNDRTGFRVSSLVPPTPPVCVGDLNGDNAVNTADLTRFLGLFGTNTTPGGAGDFNCDGVVNTVDLTRFLGRFGSAC
ncbi:MAG: SUMF1/EgtB/PvdO family nonheme iron enzyme [Phycisphaerales bacterium]